MSTFFAKKNRKPDSWTLYEEIWKDGKRDRQVKVPKQAYISIGIDPTLTLEAARKRVKQINSEKKLDRHQMAEAARRVAKIGFYEDSFFPQVLVDAFTERIRINTAGSPEHLKKLHVHFNFIQEMIMNLKFLPGQYNDNAPYFYDYMIQRRVSVDYAKKLFQMLNMWGRFVAKLQGSFYEEIEPLPRKFRGKMAKAQRGKVGVRRESERLTLDLLAKLKHGLKPAEYNWLFVSFWFGLRPIEVDQLVGTRLDLRKNKQTGITVLAVNQTKIEGEDEEESLKYIPILFPEQQEALTLLSSGDLKRPKVADLRKFSGEDIDTYTGRKGFVDLMQSLGQQNAHSSVWMGHKDLKTTLIHYKDPTNVPFTVVKKSETAS